MADSERPTGRPAREGTDADTSGGPHASRPVAGRPVWGREEPDAARRGFRKALFVVLGIAFAFLIGAVLFASRRDQQTQLPSPLSRPGADQPADNRSGAVRQEPFVPPQNVGTGQNQGGGGDQTAPQNPRTSGPGAPPSGK